MALWFIFLLLADFILEKNLVWDKILRQSAERSIINTPFPLLNLVNVNSYVIVHIHLYHILNVSLNLFSCVSQTT